MKELAGDLCEALADLRVADTNGLVATIVATRDGRAMMERVRARAAKEMILGGALRTRRLSRVDTPSRGQERQAPACKK